MTLREQITIIAKSTLTAITTALILFPIAGIGQSGANIYFDLNIAIVFAITGGTLGFLYQMLTNILTIKK